MALLDYALTTTASVKEYMKLSDAEYNANLNLIISLINSATRYIESFCGRRFKETIYTDELHDGDGTTILDLPNYPLTAIASIYRTYDVGTDELYDSTYYKRYEDEGYVYRKAGWFKGKQNIKITYTAGYDPIPADLEELCNAMVAFKYDAAARTGIKSEKIGKYAITYSEVSLPEEIMAQMASWVNYNV